MVTIESKYKTRYIATLPDETQQAIRQELASALEGLSVKAKYIREGMAGRLCDLEDAIEIEYI